MKRVLVIAGRVGSDAWSSGDVVTRVVRELSERGCKVSLVAESVEDSEHVREVGAGFVVAMNRFEQSASDFPFGFASWARRQRGLIEHDTCVSFSRSVGGDVWMPLDPTAWSWLGQLVSARGVLKSLPTVAKHWGVVRAAAGVSRAGAKSKRVLAVGAVAAQGARRRARGAEVREVEFFAPVNIGHEAHEGARLARVRELINVREEVGASATAPLLICVNASGRVGPSLVGLFQEIAQAHGPMSPIAGPLAAVLTR